MWQHWGSEMNTALFSLPCGNARGGEHILLDCTHHVAAPAWRNRITPSFSARGNGAGGQQVFSCRLATWQRHVARHER
eukprot:6286220-Pyramimonas_sp.AAC.1